MKERDEEKIEQKRDEKQRGRTAQRRQRKGEEERRI